MDPSVSDDKPLAWWQHPAKVWFRDPGFWREVTARALSALIAAAVIYGLALMLGYIQSPPGRNLVRALSITGGSVLFAFAFVWVVEWGLRQLPEHRRRRARLIFIYAFMVVVSVALLIVDRL